MVSLYIMLTEGETYEKKFDNVDQAEREVDLIVRDGYFWKEMDEGDIRYFPLSRIREMRSVSDE